MCGHLRYIRAVSLSMNVSAKLTKDTTLYKMIILNYILTRVKEKRYVNKLIKLLICYGANPNIVDEYGRNVLMNAIRHGHDIDELIKSIMDINARDNHDWSALSYACYSNNEYVAKRQVCVVERLVQNGADVEYRYNKDINISYNVIRAPLHCAIDSANKKISQILIDHGANINIRDELYENTYLLHYVLHGNLEIVNFLIQMGADVNIKNIYGESCLMIAAVMKDVEIFRLLVKNGADINTKNIYGRNSLMEYIINEYKYSTHIDENFVVMMLENGTDISAVDNSGYDIFKHVQACRSDVQACRSDTKEINKHNITKILEKYRSNAET